MSKKEKQDTVYAEGNPVMTTTSPYDQYRNVEIEYASESDLSSGETKKTLRLECLKLAAMIKSHTIDTTVIVDTAKRYYQYVKTGE